MPLVRWLRSGLLFLPVLGCIEGALADAPSLQRGIDALKSGNATLAARLLTAELEAPGGTTEQRARTLYFRAKAYLASQQPGLAMSDAGAAIWLNKLSPLEAADAEAIKAQSMAFAGVGMGPVTVKPVVISAVAPVAPARIEALVERPLPKEAVVIAPKATLAPEWSAAAVRREELAPASVVNEVALKTVAPASAPAWAAPTSLIETGSIAPVGIAAQVPVPATVPMPALATVKPAQSVMAPLVEKVEPPVTGPGFLAAASGLGSLFEKPVSPAQAEIERANELQRSYGEKIRRHNRELAARNAGWASNQTVAGE